MRGLGKLQQFTGSREAAANALLFVILVLMLPMALASSPTIFNDGDVSWHLASGQWMLENARIPTADPFSTTAAGHPWVAMEWLADVIFASAYRIAGYAGVTTIVAAAMLALHALLFFHLQRRVGPLAIVVTFLVLDFVLTPFILARPHLLVWPLVAAWTIVLLNAAEQKRAPPVWAVLILTLWTNMHASFPIALPIGAGIAFDALQKTGRENWREWVLFALASLVAITLNANGLRGLTYPFHVAGLAMLPLIQEWQPSSISVTPLFYVALGIGLFALLYKGVRVPLGRLLLLLALCGLAFSQVRHQSWFVIVACCLIPPLVGTAPTRSASLGWLAFAAVPLLLARALWPIVPVENAANPRHLIAAVPASLRGRPVFNGYSFGGPLILAGIKPYIDGRADMYGDSFVLDYSRIMDGDPPRFRAAVKRYDIRWTMLPAGSRLAQELDRSPAWARIYSDRVGVIHVRRN